MRTALTIAGSDSGGGAGIQADLKSFASVGVHGTSVITCVTAQNTRSVDSIFPIPAAEIRKQLRAVLGDFNVRAAKTGMLYSAEIVRVVARELRGTTFPLVVDPVMVATVGASLEQDDFADALVDRLLGRRRDFMAQVAPWPPRPRPTSPSADPSVRPSNPPAGRSPRGSASRTGPAAGSKSSIPTLCRSDETGTAEATLHSCLRAYYQRTKDRPQTSSRLTKIQPRADTRRRLGSRLHRAWQAQSTAR